MTVRQGIVLSFAALMLVLLLVQPVEATDGAESSASILSFSETLADDTGYFPDSFLRTTIETADADYTNASSETGSYTDTAAVGGNAWETSDAISFYSLLTFTLPTGIGTIEGIKYAMYAKRDGSATILDVVIVGTDDNSKDDIGDLGLNYAWFNGTTYNPKYWNTSFYAGIHLDTTAGLIDYCELTVYVMHLAGSGHYAESFCDLTGWTSYICEGHETFTTDGDVASFAADKDSSSDYDHYYDPSISLAAGSRYCEIRYRFNTTNFANTAFTIWTGTPPTGMTETGLTKTTTWTTLKVYSTAAIESIGVYVRMTDALPGPVCMYIDYLRASDETETGWAHDGSTTQATSNDAESGFTYATSTDGDVLSCNVTRTSGSGATFVELRTVFDTTTTAADLERDYYPFWAACVKITRSSAASTIVYANLFSDGYNSLVTSDVSALADWTTLRANHKASSTADSNKYWRIGGYLTAVGDWIRLQVDYVKVYSIANWTVSQGNCEVGDLLYVSSSVLYCSSLVSDANEYIRLDYDPTLSVNTATYNIWNITTNAADDHAEFYFYDYVGAWSSARDNTRGALTSGTMTDIRFQFNGDASASTLRYCSAIRFITDATKPDIVRANAAPTDADDSETVTLSAVASDTLEVYQVYFNAITYPVGFSDVNYYATEQSSNLWTYSFTTMTAGYYCFAVYASDGANINDLDYYSYLDFTVREADIDVTTITLFGAGNDFTFVTWTFDINRACTYTIREWSATYAAADTWTGSVAEGIRNIAWQKLSVTDDSVNFTVTFLNGSLSYVFSSSYATPKSTFYWLTEPTTGEAGNAPAEYVWCSGSLSKGATYTIFVNDTQKETGSVTGDFKLTIEKGSTPSMNYDYAFRFVNGSQTLWKNATYWTNRYPSDKEEQGGDVDYGDWRTSEKWWLMFGIAAAVVGVVAVYAKVGEKERRLIQ